jgi:hypothetical protein
MNANELMDLEKKVGEALGYSDFRSHPFSDTEWSVFSPSNSDKCVRDTLPMFTRSWDACGPLMVEYGCYPQDNGTGSVYFPVLLKLFGSRSPCELIAHYPDKDTAVRAAICQAVLFVIKVRQTGEPGKRSA